MRLGIDLSSCGGIAERVAVARWADERGVDDIWTSEVADPDAFVVLAALAAATDRARLGTQIVPIGVRSTPNLAAAASSVCQLAAGRLVLGLGVSTRVIVEEWHGASFHRPLERARETFGLLRQILAGERTAFAGNQVRSRGFKLRTPPTPPPALALAALNPTMLQLAGEIADGVWLNFVPAEAMPAVLAAIDVGVERSGRDRRPEVLLTLKAGVSDHGRDDLHRFRNEFFPYMTAEPYQRAFESFGFGAEVAAARVAWSQGDRSGVLAACSDGLLRSVTAFGDAGFCERRIREYAQSGVDTLIVTPCTEDVAKTLHPLFPDSTAAPCVIGVGVAGSA